MPQRVNRLEYRGKNVLDEISGRGSQLLGRHDLILSKRNLFEPATACTIKGTIDPESFQELMALKLHLTNWEGPDRVAPNERGRTWKKVSKA